MILDLAINKVHKNSLKLVYSLLATYAQYKSPPLESSEFYEIIFISNARFGVKDSWIVRI